MSAGLQFRGRKAKAKPSPDALTRVPAMPKYLPDEMRQEWARVCKTLIDRKLLDYNAIGHVGAYIFHAWQIATFAEKLKAAPTVEDKFGFEKPSPFLGAMNKASELHARYGAELGLSPAARSKNIFIDDDNNDKKNVVSTLGLRRHAD